MMQLLSIEQLGSAVLRESGRIVSDFKSPVLTQLINNMLYTLEISKGVGLAAPQVSQSLQLLIVSSRPTVRYPHAPLMQPVVMMNPAYQPLSDEQEKDWEGCLSIPGIRALVPRYKKIRVSYTDLQEKQIDSDLEGFVARIFQHEYDHLQGMVYLDRVENNRDIISETEFFKLLAA